jgi:hypothetical protein
MSRTGLPLIALVVLALVGVKGIGAERGFGRVAGPAGGGQGIAGGEGAVVDPVARALAGAIDIHVHSLPDNVPRSVDVFEAATLAKAHGMRGLVLKNHYDQTAGYVYEVRKLVPGIEVFGGIDLNLPQGGMNPHAVEHMTQITGEWGRFVWMSTFDAENAVKTAKENRPFVSVSKDGALLSATKDVISVVAKHNLVLASGHTSAEEGLMIFREGKRQGVQHMVMTHAENSPISATIAQMKAAIAEGAFIEFCGSTLLPASAAERMDKWARDIRELGPEHVILSTDLGQANNPLPPDGFAAFMLALKARGYTDQELDMMAKENPAKVLGLPSASKP